MIAPALTFLYVPGDRPDRIEKAFASVAHAVIVDLEDAVAPPRKAEARANLADLLGHAREKPAYVRVNPGDEADLEAVAKLALAGVFVPKVAGPEDVPRLSLPVHCLLESARGVEAAFEIARTDGVAGISLGESDLRAETGATEAGLDWARSRIVNAAVAAGLRGRRSPSTRICATSRASPRRAGAGVSSAISVAPRSIRSSCR